MTGCLLLLMAASSLGGPPPPVQSEFDAFTTSRGLIHNYVKTFFQDRDGFLWIGTMGGLSRFDGMRFDNFALGNELGTDEVLAVFQTPDGTVHAMTPSGFARYDSDAFHADPVNPSISNLDLKKLLLDSAGRMWVGARQGLFMMKDQNAVHFTPVRELVGWNITALFEDRQGGIWVASRQNGLAYLAPDTPPFWQFFGEESGLPHLIVNDVTQDADGTIWAATLRGVAFLNNGRFKKPSFHDQLPHPIIYEIHCDRQSRLWFRTSLAGLVVWDGSTLTHFTQNDGLAHNNTIAMLEDQSGRIWFASNRGLTLFQNGKFRVLDTSSGLSSLSITTVFEDRQGIIWVGTSRGFHRHESHRLKTFMIDTPKTAIPPFSQIYSIFQDSEKNLWFPSYRGLGVYDGQEFQLFDQSSGLPSPEIHCVLEDKHHRIWVGTPSGPAFLEDQVWHAVDDPLLSGVNITQMIRDREGILWFLTGDYGIIMLDSELNTPASLASLPIGNDPINEIHADERGFAWFFSTSSALCVRDGDVEKLEFSQIGPGTILFDKVFNPDGTIWLGTNRGLVAYGRKKIHVITHEEGLPGTFVRRVFRAHDGSLWLGLTMANLEHMGREEPVGIAKFDGLSFSLFQQKDGLLSDSLSAVADFGSNHLWFLHAQGITRMKDGKFARYSISQGLAGNRPNKIVRDKSDSYWIATSGGLNKFRDGLLATYSESDGLLAAGILDLHLDAKDHLWIRTRRGVQRYVEKISIPRVKLEHLSSGNRHIPINQSINFTQNDGTLNIHYRGINISRGAEKLQFLYSLSDDHEHWIGPTRDTKVTLPLHNMRPGSYTFAVKAFSPDLYPTAEPAVFEFSILPPIWLTPWFLILAALAVISLAYVLYRRRMTQSIEKGRILHQLQVAREMQMSLMPEESPIINGWDISSYCRPALEVGGDYFDFFWLDEEQTKLGVAVVDVSGKSMEAAIIAVMTSGLLYGAISNQKTPQAILSKLNETLYRKTPKNTFTTAFFTAIDLSDKSMTFANAGQIQPMLVRSGKVTELKVPGIRVPLAAVPEVAYESAAFQLMPGDLLLLYTDGLSEAMNRDRQMFGHDRIQRILSNLGDEPSNKVVARILNEMDRFIDGLSPHDDITIIAIRVENEFNVGR